MENTLTWNSAVPVLGVEEKLTAMRRALVLSGVIVLATISLCGWVYGYGKKTLHERAVQVELQGGLGASETNFDLLRRFDQIALSVTAMGVVGGVGCLVPLSIAFSRWRRRTVRLLEKRAEDLQSTTAGLQNQLQDARRSREELLTSQASLEEQLKTVTLTNARLQSELNKLNRAEKAFTAKRQELESSKSVLELHVQARTQELQILQRRHEMILNSAGEGICGFDSEGKTTFANPTVEKLTGWSIADLIGKTENEVFLRKEQQAPATVAEQTLGEAPFYRKDGTCFPVEYIKTPIKEKDRVVGSVLMFKDITERKRVDETLAQRASELARSNAELEQFAFVASHDLQEPLRKIQAFGDRLKAKCEGLQSQEIQDYLERMQSAAGRMRTLINDLLTFSRVIRSSDPFVEVELEQVTKEVLGDLEVRIEKSGAKVEVGVLPKLAANPMQMRQLMLNLVSNALKFQPAGASPVVKIQSRNLTSGSGEPLCELTVQDNGIGFDEKYLDKIFAVFQRLHGRSSEYEGTGVGLAVCRRIVDRHHGTITATSKPGQGATFIVTLPLRQASAASSP